MRFDLKKKKIQIFDGFIRNDSFGYAFLSTRRDCSVWLTESVPAILLPKRYIGNVENLLKSFFPVGVHVFVAFFTLTHRLSRIPVAIKKYVIRTKFLNPTPNFQFKNARERGKHYFVLNQRFNEQFKSYRYYYLHMAL